MFSEKLGAYFLDQQGEQQPVIMGCYGIGVGRLLAAAVEQNHDQKGIVWPAPIAPYQAHLVSLGAKTEVVEEAASVYQALGADGLDVLYDDRDESAGVKFNDADLLGMPVRVTVSQRGLRDGQVEIKGRTASDPVMASLGEAVAAVRGMLA